MERIQSALLGFITGFFCITIMLSSASEEGSYEVKSNGEVLVNNFQSENNYFPLNPEMKLVEVIDGHVNLIVKKSSSYSVIQTPIPMSSYKSYFPNMTIIEGYIIDDPQIDYLNEPTVVSSINLGPLQKYTYQNPYPKQLPQILTTTDHGNPGVDDGQINMETIEIKQIRIAVDTSALEEKMGGSFDTAIDAVIESMLPPVVSLWENVLKVVNGIPSDENLILPSTNAAAQCGPVSIPTEHTSIGIVNADIVVYVDGILDCGGETTDDEPLSYGASCVYDSTTFRPLAGYLAVCLDKIKVTDGAVSGTVIQANQYVQAHELGHILGFDIDLFEYYFNFENKEMYGSTVKEVTCVNGTTLTLSMPKNLRAVTINGATFYEVVTTTIVNIAKNHFNV